MKVKVIMLLFLILAISTLKQGSALVPDGYVEENVALRGRATQLDQLQGQLAAFSHASNAIDGNRDSYFFHGSCTHTSGGANPWWRVDLLQVYTITSVTITNRGDCCGERISGARILIGKHLKNNGINNPRCSVIGSMAAGETKTFRCPQPMIGRYVTVYLPKTESLHLCEVEVNVLFPAPC
ncbi:fucolectin-7-like isoform X1 [Anguilla anguilla]|uniref:fucolectin-7-like isoform X1 n=1 Tax=Anguilla anguilla TaxID=7936 RepID=UPI0015B05EB7|nr:fucolectin-7-like isoform X1 [Anguilla anguilla]XP_035276844.1 fucolectin-7-like isoform X1 [Anguilla anguilla]